MLLSVNNPRGTGDAMNFSHGSHRALLTVDQVPPYLREPAIITGYRPLCCSPVQCVASLFNATNETLNFWTHFIPTWYFVWQLVHLQQTLDLFNDPYAEAFVTYMLTCCAYPFISCSAHAFSSMSDAARHICYFVDYGTLSIYGYGAAVLYCSYVLPVDIILHPWPGSSTFRDYFMGGSAACAVLCTLCACASRFVKSKLLLKGLRLGAFTLPFIWINLPLAYRFLYCHHVDDCAAPSLPLHARQVAVALLGGLVYALHVPERLAPGRFDIVGHSHQWLHVCGVLATYFQMNGALLDLQDRRAILLQNGWAPLPRFWTYDFAVILLLLDAAIVAAFSLSVFLRRNRTAEKLD